jgi:hypothetical protein
VTKPTDPQDSTRTDPDSAAPGGESGNESGRESGADAAARDTGTKPGAGNGTVRPSPRPRPVKPDPPDADASTSDPSLVDTAGAGSDSTDSAGHDPAPAGSPWPAGVPENGAAPAVDARDELFDHEAERALADPPAASAGAGRTEAEPAPGSAPGGINGQPEAPAAALPPPWQRIPDSAGPDTPEAEREPAATESTGSPSPSPRPRPPSRPRGAAAAAAAAAAATEVAAPEPAVRRPRTQRTEQTDLGSARTVSLDPGRYGTRPGDSAGPPGPPGSPEPDERAGSGRSSGGFQMGWPRNRRPRQASLQLKRLDPWSVLKIALVLAVVLYLVWLVAVGVLYGVLDGIGVWDRLNGQYADLVTEQAGDRLISAGRVFGAAAVIGAVNSLLFAVALSVGAFVYNVSADLVGGVEVTLSERD